ncbi:MAG: response regulator [Cellvibrionaceae bacterium]|nr:response regulator [Cellvibrionaceae bacterium]
MPDNNPSQILIVEDEPQLGSLIQDYLIAEGYKASHVENGLEVDPWLASHSADLILLDLMLPGKSGLDICRDVRMQSAIPIIMVTAKVEEIDRLLGLELGADDYICKPFSPREVVARVKAVLRRYSQESIEQSGGKVELDQFSNCVKLEGKRVELTSIEFSLFKLLFQEPGRIFSRQFIMDNIYNDYRVVSDRTVDSHIKKLRKKLQDAAPDYEVIRSVYGAGYKYDPPE